MFKTTLWNGDCSKNRLRRSIAMSRNLLFVFTSMLAACSTISHRDDAGHEPRTVVITGASSGFGKGVALQLAARGDNVVLAARRTELLEQAAHEAGGRALVVTTDVSNPADIERLGRAAIDRFGHIDVWINDAGVGALGRFEDIPLQDHVRVIDVNLKGVLYGSYFAMQHFRDRGRGTLINIASVAGRVPFPYYSSYVSSKHGVVGLGDALNQELQATKRREVHVVTVNPFATDTPWFDHAANYTGHRARSVMLDPPEKVVTAIVRAVDHPRKQINVGYKANAAVVSQRISRGLTESAVAEVIDRAQMEKAAPAAPTAGTLYTPMPEGTAVNGGVRARMAAEDRTRDEPEAVRR
jgi:short-subunit dehydrogenase